jgi:hypothetical protein
MIRCFALPGQGRKRCMVVERVPCVVGTPAHSVCLDGTGLVACAPGEADCACVPNLDFMSVGPAVALLVPGGFD